MKILVIGSGGREHALGLKLSQAPEKPVLTFAPGNPGMAALGACVPVAADDVDGLLALALRERFDLTVVGPEVPLVKGVVDAFQAAGLAIFGPTAAAARLEGSKAFSKDFMARHAIPTAAFRTFNDHAAARDYLEATGAPVVVKASGLAAGKGAVVCMTLDEARAALDSMLGPDAVFGDAGREVVIEEFMEGEEASVFAVCDGTDFVLLPTAQDHKRAYDHDEGPNTGGMGAYAPAPVMTPALLEETARTIVAPTLAGMRAEGCPYQGVLFVGLMLTTVKTDGGTRTIPRVVEFNCRLGDPETQVVLPLFEGNFVELLLKASQGKLKEYAEVQAAAGTSRSAAVIVLASGGYPGDYKTGLPVTGVADAAAVPGAGVLHAGTKLQEDLLVTAGGRVLGVTGEGATLKAALDTAYAALGKIAFEGMHYRRDIGRKGLA